MDQVPQKVLNWLHSVLIGEYNDVNRTFSDTAQSLQAHNTLRPSTDVYTFEDGASSLLLHVTGTLPTWFRGSFYSFPISLWIPRSYPLEAPISFVTPTPDMIVRPGQYISGEGRIYHPYLAGWRPDRSSLLEFLSILQDVFSREPPVIAKQSQGLPAPSRPAEAQAPPRPPLPSELRQSTPSEFSRRSQSSAEVPPPPPPKPSQQKLPLQNQSNSMPPAPPPRPPIPPSQNRPQSQILDRTLSQQWRPQRPVSHYMHERPPDSRTNQPVSGPPLEAAQQVVGVRYSTQTLPTGPNVPSRHFSSPMQPNGAQGPAAAAGDQPRPAQQYPPAQFSGAVPYAQQQHIPYLPQPQQAPRKPPEDLLSSPFDPPLPQASDIPAPPIPPNPEKDALLTAISHKLTAQIQSATASNQAALQPLASQHVAMTNALHNMQQEHNALAALQNLLTSNETILHNAMHDADDCIASAQHKAVPGVDEVLVAPTVVGQQLYNLVAEEKACVETREVVGRALDRGRISSETWVKTVRSLAREEFLKKVLIRKCADGMGLRGEADVT